MPKELDVKKAFEAIAYIVGERERKEIKVVSLEKRNCGEAEKRD